MRRSRFLVLSACLAAAACGSSSEPASRVDHLELTLDPARPAYPVSDVTNLHVAAFDVNGALLPSTGVTVRSLSPSVALVSPGSIISTVGKGTAVIEASLEGKTAQITVNVRGTRHASDMITQNETWQVADTPHVVYHYIDVLPFGAGAPDTVIVTIEAGSTVRFRTGAGLFIANTDRAALRITDGGAPVVMEADTVSPHAGSWTGLRFARVGNSALRHLTMRHCGHNDPDGNPAACLVVGGFDPGTQLRLLLDDVTITDAHNGVDLGPWFTLLPGSKNLSIRNTDGFLARVSAFVFGDFPRGGTFTGNASNEIEITGGVIRDSATWSELGPPLRLRGGVTMPADVNAILRLAPGLHLRADVGAGFTFANGGVVAGDTSGPPVVLESTGQGWYGIATAHAGLSALYNVVLKDCGRDSNGCLVLDGCAADSGLVANNLMIQGSKSAGVFMGICGKIHPSSPNLTITGSASVPLDLTAWSIPFLPSGAYTGNGWDVIRVRASASLRMRWRNFGIPYALIGGYNADSTLTVAPGVTIQVDTGHAFGIGWGFISEGTAAEPITFTSITPGVPGSWMGINTSDPPEGAQLDHVIIADAGGGPPGFSGALRFGVDPGGVLTNSTIVRSSSCALILFNGNSWTDDYTDPLFGNTFTNIAGALRCQV